MGSGILTNFDDFGWVFSRVYGRFEQEFSSLYCGVIIALQVFLAFLSVANPKRKLKQYAVGSAPLPHRNNPLLPHFTLYISLCVPTSLCSPEELRLPFGSNQQALQQLSRTYPHLLIDPMLDHHPQPLLALTWQTNGTATNLGSIVDEVEGVESRTP